MSWFWIVIEISATFFEAMVLFSFLNTFLEKTVAKKLIYAVLPVLHTIFVSLLNYISLTQFPTALLVLLFSCLIVFFFYSGNMIVRIGLTIAFYAIWMASELGILLLLSSVFKNFMINLQEPSIERITAIVLNKLTIFIVLKVVQQFSVSYKFEMRFKKSLPLYILPLTTIVVVFSMQTFWANQPPNNQFILAGISLICLLFANFIVFDQYKRYAQEAEVKFQIEQIKQNQASQTKITKMMETQNREVRKIAHDLRNSLLPSILYIQQGKPKQGLEILEEIVDKLNVMQQTPEITGHSMIDLVITSKISKAKASDIKLNVTSILKQPISLSDSDISVILGNGLDNAIEAATKVDNKCNKIIDIQFRSERGIFTIKITNPIDKDVVIQGGRIKSLKPDYRNHGIGLNSISELVRRNNGYLSLQSKHNYFTLLISFENSPLNA